MTTETGQRSDTDAMNPSDAPTGTDERRGVRRRFLGKFRGTVVENIDPLDQGRIMVEVPAVLGLSPSSWAMPCVPLADLVCGFYPRPPVGAGVWVEFEQGDVNYPIWVGGYWSTSRPLPLGAQAAVATSPTDPVITIETRTGGVTISDTPMGIFGTLSVRSGASSIVFTETGIEIVAPSVSFVTPSLSVNETAFRVTGP